MIFVTIGTTPFPFLRMRDIVASLVHDYPEEKVVFQHGATPPVYGKNITNFSSLPYLKIKALMRKARRVVCHGGAATIFQVLEAGRTPYALPRRKAFGEHVDDHQVHFIDHLRQRQGVNVIDQNNLHDVMYFTQRKKLYREPQLSKNLIRFLHSITQNSPTV